MNCLIVDKDKQACIALSKLINMVDFITLQEECSNSFDAFNFLNKKPVDLIFLEVEMPGMTGIELIKNLEKRPIIILMSAKKDYAVEAFELNVGDYITKPLTLSRFMIAVSRAKELFESNNQKLETGEREKEYIFVRSQSVLTKIKTNEIIYIQALGDYVNIHTTDKRHTVHITLSGIAEKLPADKFYKLHRSYLVALDQVDAIEESTAYVEKYPIPISESFKKGLLKKLNLIC